MAGSIDGTDIYPDCRYPFVSSIVRLEEDNELKLFGNDLEGFDNLAVACAPSGTLYFTCGEGIHSISKLGAAPWKTRAEEPQPAPISVQPLDVFEP